MERYTFQVPRWYAALYLIVAVLFTVGFLYTVLQHNVLEKNPLFFMIGVVMLLFGLVTAVYVFVTGKYPFTMRPRM